MPGKNKGRKPTPATSKKTTATRNLDRDKNKAKAAGVGVFHARARQKENYVFRERGRIPQSLRNDRLFKELQFNFFKALSTLPATIANGIARHQNEMTGKQKYDLAAVGEALSSSVPMDFLTDSTSAFDAYQICINNLNRLNNILNSSPGLVSLIGKPLQQNLIPLTSFLEKSLRTLEHSHLSDPLKNPIVRGLGGVRNTVELLNTTIDRGLTIAQPDEELPTLSHLDHFKHVFQSGFFKALMPVPFTIVQALISLHDALSPDQKRELSDIGKGFVTTAFDLITARRPPEKCFESVAHNFIRLGELLSNAPELLVKAGALFLKNTVPFGSFLGRFLESITGSDLPQESKLSLSGAVRHTQTVLNEFRADIQKDLSVGPKGPRPS